MAVTIANIITNVDTYIGDASTDRISQAERFQAITESVVWLLEELGNDHANKTYTLNFLDTVNYYKITSAVSDLLDSADLRRDILDHTISAAPKSARDIAEDIGQGGTEFAWAIERRDANAYLVVNLDSKNKAQVISAFDSLTDGGGDWEIDETTSDATNLTVDTVEFKQGSGCLNFDADVSQSGNNRITVSNSTLNELDLSSFEDLSSWLFWAYVPENANFSSFTLYWGSDSSNYWSATVTTDINGSAWADGWNEVKVNWADATMTGTPDVSAIDYIRIDFNYTGSQTDDTDFRLDYLRIAKPEKLTFHYVSWNVGANNSGTALSAFTATTDVPFFSGQYDQYKYPVSHKAASILLYTLRLKEEAIIEEGEAVKSLKRVKGIFPSSRIPETKNFKVKGINFARRRTLRGF